jgi:hypothetical protein
MSVHMVLSDGTIAILRNATSETVAVDLELALRKNRMLKIENSTPAHYVSPYHVVRFYEKAE